MQNDMQLYVNKSQRGKTREGTLLRVDTIIQLTFHTQDLEAITNNDRADLFHWIPYIFEDG